MRENYLLFSTPREETSLLSSFLNDLCSSPVEDVRAIGSLLSSLPLERAIRSSYFLRNVILKNDDSLNQLFSVSFPIFYK